MRSSTRNADAITAVGNQVQRIVWWVLGVGVIALGIFLIFAGDLEKLGEKAVDIAEKAAPAAAEAA